MFAVVTSAETGKPRPAGFSFSGHGAGEVSLARHLAAVPSCFRTEGHEILSDNEVRDIYAAADIMGDKNDYMEKCWRRYRPMIYLAGFSGMRPSEIRGLAWPQITEAAVHVKQRADKTGIIGSVKSKAGKRTIYLPRVVTDMVFEWREYCPASPYDLIFPTDTGRPQALNNFRAGAWLPLMEEAGLIRTETIDGKPSGGQCTSPMP